MPRFTIATVLGLALCLSRGVLSRSHPEIEERAYTCTVPANGDGSDDTQNILDAFKECNVAGRNVIFSADTTYYVNSVMNTTDLKSITVDIYGKLLVMDPRLLRRVHIWWADNRRIQWSKDTDYWLNHSMPVGYQNQSTVWLLGGEGLKVNGHGTGTFDGNGQTWYDLVKGVSNYPGEPPL
jgi:galacturan 1,4-alpha-galacturonidase